MNLCIPIACVTLQMRAFYIQNIITAVGTKLGKDTGKIQLYITNYLQYESQYRYERCVISHSLIRPRKMEDPSETPILERSLRKGARVSGFVRASASWLNVLMWRTSRDPSVTLSRTK